MDFLQFNQRLSTSHTLATPANGQHRSRCSRYSGFHQIRKECVDTYPQQSTKRWPNDNLCVVRALAAFQQNSKHGLETKTMELFQMYIRGVQKNVQEFTGIELTDLPDVKKFCSCAIQVFSAELDVKNVVPGELLYRSKTLEMDMQSNVVDLLLVDNQTCLIRNPNVFFRRFKCTKCEQYFSRLFDLNRHLKSCSEKSDHSYPGGKYTPTDTFFTTLETVFDVCIPHGHRFYKSFVTFDFISILRQKSSSQQTNGFDTNQEDCFSTQQRLHRFLKRTRTQILQYIDQLPIVGFSSGFYDLNLIKPYLLRSLQRFVSLSCIKCNKRNTRFLLLSTPSMRFMDCSHFVAAGTSLDKFLKAYGSEVSYILSNNETGEYRYYHSSDNTTVLSKPKLVENFDKCKLLKQDIFSTDFIEKITNFRDSTKWTFFSLTNVSLHPTHLPRLPMGSTDQDVVDTPDFIKSARSVWTLTHNNPRKDGLMIIFA